MGSYLERMNWIGICIHADACENTECAHRTRHPHHTWGSKHAGGPWSCVEQEHCCPYKETDEMVICRKI